ncbi:helix-turn-helix transcriptional regulator [Eggerthellaceae bacterium 24-137]
MTHMKQGRFQIEPSCLGLSATLATLPVFEPALHSFATLDRFHEVVTPFVLCALLSFTATAIVLLLAQGIARYRWLRDSLALVGAGALLAIMVFDLPWIVAVPGGLVAGAASAFVMEAWGMRYCGCSIQKALLHIAVSCVLAALLMNLVGTTPLVASAALFLILSVVGADMPAWDVSVKKAEEMPASCASFRPLLVGLAEPLIGLFLFSLMFSTLGDHRVYLYYLSFLLGTLASGLCIVPLLLINSKRPLLNLIYQVILPLLGLVLIVVALMAPIGFQGAVSRSGFMLFFAFAAMLFCASIVGYLTAGEFAPRRILGVSMGAYGLGGVIGTAVVLAGGRTEFITSVFLALTCIYIVSLAIKPSVLAWLGKESAGLSAPGAADDEEKPREDAANALADRFGLTEREREILGQIAAGHSSSYVARVLFISESTVRGHVHHLYQKLGVSSREELIALVAVEQRG